MASLVHLDSLGSFRRGIEGLVQNLERQVSSEDPYALGKTFVTFSNSTSLTADIKETKDGYTAYLDAPGVFKSDISIDVHDVKNTVTIVMEKKVPGTADGSNEKERAKESGWLVRERVYGKMQRIFIFPEAADLTNAQVTLEDGVLMLHVPRRVIPHRKLTIQ